MKEEWKDIFDFPGYQVSNTGKVRTFWHKQKKFGVHGGTERILMNIPHDLPQSDDGNGYLKVLLRNDVKRKCAKVHRLVAEAFIPRPSEEFDTVDHIISGPMGKLDNSINNLQWKSRRENIQKAYRDGVCEERIRLQRRNILVTDVYDNQEVYFDSVAEAANWLGVNYTTVSHALKNGHRIHRRYTVSHLEGEEKMLYDWGYFDAINYNY